MMVYTIIVCYQDMVSTKSVFTTRPCLMALVLLVVICTKKNYFKVFYGILRLFYLQYLHDKEIARIILVQRESVLWKVTVLRRGYS